MFVVVCVVVFCVCLLTTTTTRQQTQRQHSLKQNIDRYIYIACFVMFLQLCLPEAKHSVEFLVDQLQPQAAGIGISYAGLFLMHEPVINGVDTGLCALNVKSAATR